MRNLVTTIFAASILCSSIIAKAEPSKLIRSFTLTPGYMERTFNSNKMMKLGPLSLMQLTSKGFDAAVGAVDHPAAKTAVGGLFLIPYIAQGIIGQVMYHEYGHARAAASMGYKYRYIIGGDTDISTDYAFGFYYARLLNPKYIFTQNGSTQYLSTDFKMPEKFKDRINQSLDIGQLAQGDLLLQGASLSSGNLYTSIAGLNNQMQYSKAVADLIFKNNGHFLYALEYFSGKSIPLFYTLVYKNRLKENKNKSGDDIMNILNGYNPRGYDVKANDFIIGSAASVLLSATTWSFVYSAFTELPKGSFIVHAPVWHGWRLPDLNFYATTQGLSFEIITGYQFNENWYAGLTTEFVYMGNTAYEFGPSIGYSFNTSVGQFDLSTQLVVSNEFELGGGAGIEWTSLGKDWTVGLKYIYHNALTLIGERNIPFLCSGFMSGGEPSHTNHELNLTLSYNY